MVMIRSEQMKAFRERSGTSFQKEMAAHLFQFAPVPCQAAGRRQVEEAVRLGTEAARHHGLTSRGAVRLYLELQTLLGADFDDDPQYPWAAATLASMEVEKADRLFEQSAAYLEKVNGPEGRDARQAAESLAAHLELAEAGIGRAAEHEMLAEMAALHPRKHAYAGEDSLQALIAEAGQAARQHSLPNPDGVVLFARLMFAFGHGAAGDPLLPWIAQALAQDPGERIRRVQRAAIDYLRRLTGGAAAGFSRAATA